METRHSLILCVRLHPSIYLCNIYIVFIYYKSIITKIYFIKEPKYKNIVHWE